MNEFHVRSTRTYPDHDLKISFEWWGGAYIQVCRGEAFASPSEVINVWDYEKDAPRIERSRDAFNMAIDSWVDSYGISQLAHDVRENW